MAKSPAKMELSDFRKAISGAHPDALAADAESEQWLEIIPDKWGEVALTLRDDKALRFDYLSCLSGYDEGVDGQLAVIYNLHSMELLQQLEIRVKLPREGGRVPSVAHIWRAADWHEREAYDMYGMTFSGHPDLRRMLLPEDWVGHPLLKDYETPEYYRGIEVEKDKRGWE